MCKLNICNVSGESGRVLEEPPFGPGVGVIWMDDVQCTGRETTLDQCAHRGWGQHDCTHDEDAAVECDTAGMMTYDCLMIAYDCV